jgi:hypothetical protein
MAANCDFYLRIKRIKTAVNCCIYEKLIKKKYIFET